MSASKADSLARLSACTADIVIGAGSSERYTRHAVQREGDDFAQPIRRTGEEEDTCVI
jgi:hypothetical protein